MKIKSAECFICMIILCMLSGCGNALTDSGNTPEPAVTDNENALEQMIGDYDAERMMSKEELSEVNWKETISPYMEYDWLGDEHVEEYLDTSWLMQLADLNLDGQEEMLVTLPIYNGNSLTYVYTVEQGTVIYCGQIIAGAAYEDNDSFVKSGSWLLSDCIDVYRNKDGEFRYLSGNTFLKDDHGYYQIYENEFDGKSISGEPLYAINFYQDTEGNRINQYTAGDWLERKSEEADDDNYTEFTQIMEAYMEGWERADITFAASEFRVPGFARSLPEEKKEILRDNIVAGFARLSAEPEGEEAALEDGIPVLFEDTRENQDWMR